ncbi:MAG: hypothetical protein AB8G22_05330, partial [Saprospiraceae bacterium]
LILRVVDRGAFLSTHSDYVTLLVVYGVVGLGLYLFYLFRVSRKILFSLLSTSGKWRYFYQFNLLIISLIVIFGVAAENFLSPLYWLLMAMGTGSFWWESRTEIEV